VLVLEFYDFYDERNKRGGRGNVRVKFTGLISMITLSYLAETR
jgi:hypothetical protein